MFGALTPQAPDGILHLMRLFREDDRPGRIDLGVGVYRDAEGRTPVMRAVKAAERRLWETETTKTYTALAGEPAFNAAMRRLVLGDAVADDRLASAATPGGTGAIRQALELVRMASPGARVWVPEPTWPNHLSILRHLGIPAATYRYLDAGTGGADTRGMADDLAAAAPGDVVLLHGCCHNPTGADPAPDEWDALVARLAARGAVPLVDLAYQGFGEGLEADAAATRRIAAAFPECLIAVSCSKTFGLYRERAGILIAVVPEPGMRETVQAGLGHLNRQNYSFPPDHGARVVTTILGDEALAADWRAELESVRTGMLALRRALADALRAATGSDRFDFVAAHRGMFSRLGLLPDEVLALRRRHAIYMVGDSRINIAGLNAGTVPVVARAVAQVIGA